VHAWAQEAAKVHDGLEFFLTYADNNAVGYFEKQGFTKEVTMDRERARARARRRPPRVCTTPVRNTEHTLFVLASGLANAAAHARQTRQDICGCRGSDAEAMMLVSGARRQAALALHAPIPSRQLTHTQMGCSDAALVPACRARARRRRAGARGGHAAAQWVGYIKDYDGGTLMECVVHAALPYAALPAMVAAQRGALDARIRSLSNAHVVHPGLPAAPRPLPVSDIPGAALAEHCWPCGLVRTAMNLNRV